MMTPQLQQVVQNLDQLSDADRWQILEHLLGQFKPASETVTPSTDRAALSVQEILSSTRGSWGQKTVEEIDRQLADQRQRPVFGFMQGTEEILDDLIDPVEQPWEVLQCEDESKSH